MSKGKSSFKGVLFFFIILLVIAGTVCAIIFWPQKPEEIKLAINNQAQYVLSDNSDFFKNYNNYGEYAKNYHKSNATAKQAYQTAQNVFDGLEDYFYFISYAFEFADFSMYEKGQIKNTQKELANAEASLNRISNFIKEKNETLTKEGYNTRVYENADAELVWKNIATDLKETFKHYYSATTSIAKIYRKNVTSGIYSNEFAFQVVEGVGYYMNYFISNHDDFSTEGYYNMTTNFLNYVNKYIAESSGQRLAGQYLLSSNVQECAEMLAAFDEGFGEFNRETLVVKGLSTAGFSFTVAQFETIDKAVVFYKGGIAK